MEAEKRRLKREEKNAPSKEEISVQFTDPTAVEQRAEATEERRKNHIERGDASEWLSEKKFSRLFVSSLRDQ